MARKRRKAVQMTQVQRQAWRQALIVLYQAGAQSNPDAAKQVGCRYHFALDFYLKNRVELKFKPVPRANDKYYGYSQRCDINDHWEQAYAEYQAGLTLKQVGAKYGGVTCERVRQIFEKHGLKSREAHRTRIFTHCAKGHLLGKYEYPGTCKTCRLENRKAGRYKKNCRSSALSG